MNEDQNLTMESSPQKEAALLWLRFVGSELGTRSIPIYDLGKSLISVQRMIHKTFLFHKDRFTAGSNLTQAEKEMLLLQLSTWRKNSDAYGLASLLNDKSIYTKYGISEDILDGMFPL